MSVQESEGKDGDHRDFHRLKTIRRTRTKRICHSMEQENPLQRRSTIEKRISQFVIGTKTIIWTSMGKSLPRCFDFDFDETNADGISGPIH